jgi:hypothetical protein
LRIWLQANTSANCLHSDPLAPPPKESCQQARAGSINDKIDGKWQEFSYLPGPNQEVYACSSYCSKDSDSEPLGDNTSPWTVKTSASCLQLEVMEGLGGGNAVFEVFNNEVSMGKTTDVPADQGSSSCQTDPFSCNLDTGVGKGVFLLQKNVDYSIHIIARRSDCTGCDWDGGWFRLKTTPCVNGTCAKEDEKCGAAVPCCEGLGLECLSSNGNAGRTCQATVTPPVCAHLKETCGNGMDCCEGEGLVCHLNQVTGKRTCRKQHQCADLEENCEAKQCCEDFICQLDADTGDRTCSRNENATVCANAKETCGNGVPCCGSLVCHLGQATGERTCRNQTKCARAKHRCGKATKCCEGLVCRRSRPKGQRRCRKKKSSNLATCAEWKEACGNGVKCCDGLACRADQGTGKRKCRRTNNGGSGGGGTTMGAGNTRGGNGGGGAAVGPMGLGLP